MSPRSKALWWILAFLFFAVALWYSNAQTNITTTAPAMLTTVVSNDYVSIGTLHLRSGTNYDVQLPVAVTNTYVTGFGDVLLKTVRGQESTNWADARFVLLSTNQTPGPPWSMKTPNLPSK